MSEDRLNDDAGPSEIILGIPGPWKDRNEIVETAVRACSPRYVVAAMMLHDRQTKESIMMDIYPYDPHLARSFEYAGLGMIGQDVLRSVASHRHTIYLHFPLPDERLTEHLLGYTQAIRQIGGIAVKVETSGVAHDFDRWQSLLASGHPFDLYKALVTLVKGSALYCSCGMRQFQLPDCGMSTRLPWELVSETMNLFNLYQISERPTLNTGETFSVTQEAQHYRLTLQKDTLYPEGHHFHNPYGRWMLEEPRKSRFRLWR